MVSEGSIFSGHNPIESSEAVSVPLFIIQVVVIMLIGRILDIPFSRIKLPLVISEILGGIILGPSALGRIPGFQETLFPDKSIPTLSLVANTGLLFFLFVIGLELDPNALKNSAKRSVLIAAFAMVVPFTVGAPIAYGLFSVLNTEKTSFGIFLLFIGVAFGITAFPVLARILSDFDLISTPVGISTISAAAVVDVIGWCLLALVVSIVKSAQPIGTLYLFLVVIGFILFMFFLVRPLYTKFLRRFNAFETGPSEFVLFVTFAIVLLSGFFTDAIGIHAIFGGFIAGLITPRTGGFALHVREKMEYFIGVVFLPVYFALSGLKTDVSTLNDGATWGFFFLVFFGVSAGKIFGTASAARLCKFPWRDSLAVGIIMNCRGLMDLIVLNIGLDNQVIDNRIFTLMVLMALMTTVTTSLLIQKVYPFDYHSNLPIPLSRRSTRGSQHSLETKHIPTQDTYNVALFFEHITNIPAVMNLIQALHLPSLADPSKDELPVALFPLRMIHQTDFASAVITHFNPDEIAQADPTLNVLKTFGRFCHFKVKTSIKQTPKSHFGYHSMIYNNEILADLAIVVWETDLVDDDFSSENSAPSEETKISDDFVSYINYTISNTTNDLAIFLNNDFNINLTPSDQNFLDTPEIHHPRIFVFFFGLPDDFSAIKIAKRLAKSYIFTVHIVTLFEDASDDKFNTLTTGMTGTSTLSLTNYQSTLDFERKHFPVVNIKDFDAPKSLKAVKSQFTDIRKSDLVVVGRNREADSIFDELRQYSTVSDKFNNRRKDCLGFIAETILASDASPNLLVVKAPNHYSSDPMPIP